MTKIISGLIGFLFVATSCGGEPIDYVETWHTFESPSGVTIECSGPAYRNRLSSYDIEEDCLVNGQMIDDTTR